MEGSHCRKTKGANGKTDLKKSVESGTLCRHCIFCTIYSTSRKVQFTFFTAANKDTLGLSEGQKIWRERGGQKLIWWA